MNYIVNTLALIGFCYAMYLQIYNLFKYKNYNGILVERLRILSILICLTVHTIRFYSNPETMFFMLITAVLFINQYHGFDRIVNPIKKPSNPPD